MSHPSEDGDEERESPAFAGRGPDRSEVPDSDTRLDYEPLRGGRTAASSGPTASDPPDADGSEGLGSGDGRADADEAVDEFDLDRVFEALADEHRRFALHYLRDHGGAAPFEEVVDAVADSVTASEHHDRRAVQSALYHVHLPKLRDVGLVAESDPDGEVRLSSRVARLPWSLLESR